MKDILIEGHRILTTDEIAAAVLDYAQSLLERGATDVVDFPGIHDGDCKQCSLLLGAATNLVLVDAPLEVSTRLGGAERASAEITRRADALRLDGG